MEYTVALEIALPRQQVVELLQDPAHRPKWLRGLVAHEPVRGVDGQVGTESRVVFRTGKQTMECRETITRREPTDLRDVPADRVVYFEREIVAPGMWSGAYEELAESGPRRTSWRSRNVYRFSGLMRLLGPFLRRSMITQSQRVMEDFKAFAEHGADVRTADDRT